MRGPSGQPTTTTGAPRFKKHETPTQPHPRKKLRPRPPHIRTYPSTPYSPPTPAPQGTGAHPRSAAHPDSGTSVATQALTHEKYRAAFARPRPHLHTYPTSYSPPTPAPSPSPIRCRNLDSDAAVATQTQPHPRNKSRGLLRTYPTPYSPSKSASTKPTPDPLPIPIPAPQFPPKHPYLAMHTREKKTRPASISLPTTPAPSTSPTRCPSRSRRRSSHQSKPPLAKREKNAAFGRTHLRTCYPTLNSPPTQPTPARQHQAHP
jgi:hypothetical protein